MMRVTAPVRMASASSAIMSIWLGRELERDDDSEEDACDPSEYANAFNGVDEEKDTERGLVNCARTDARTLATLSF